MWGYTGSAPGTSHALALAFALVQHLLCTLHPPRGAHQHLLPQLQHGTRLAPCKWMGKGPAAPLEPALWWWPGPYPHQGHSGANRLLFGCFSFMVHACWNLLPILLFSKAGSCKTNPPPPFFVLCISLAFYQRRMSKEKWLVQESPFFSVRLFG